MRHWTALQNLCKVSVRDSDPRICKDIKDKPQTQFLRFAEQRQSARGCPADGAAVCGRLTISNGAEQAHRLRGRVPMDAPAHPPEANRQQCERAHGAGPQHAYESEDRPFRNGLQCDVVAFSCYFLRPSPSSGGAWAPTTDGSMTNFCNVTASPSSETEGGSKRAVCLRPRTSVSHPPFALKETLTSARIHFPSNRLQAEPEWMHRPRGLGR